MPQNSVAFPQYAVVLMVVARYMYIRVLCAARPATQTKYCCTLAEVKEMQKHEGVDGARWSLPGGVTGQIVPGARPATTGIWPFNVWLCSTQTVENCSCFRFSVMRSTQLSSPLTPTLLFTTTKQCLSLYMNKSSHGAYWSGYLSKKVLFTSVFFYLTILLPVIISSKATC